MTKEQALKAWEQMYEEIDKENWLYVGILNPQMVEWAIKALQPETCEGCKHLGKWEPEVEYGYSSPCTCCKRRVDDNYER